MALFSRRRAASEPPEPEPRRPDPPVVLVEAAVRFDGLNTAAVTLHYPNGDDADRDRRHWLETFLALDYLLKQQFNVGAGLAFYHELNSGTAGFRGRPERVLSPSAVYQAQLRAPRSGGAPALATPCFAPLGEERRYARQAVFALVTALRQRSNSQRRRINRGLAFLQDIAERPESDPMGFGGDAWLTWMLLNGTNAAMEYLGSEGLVPPLGGDHGARP